MYKNAEWIEKDILSHISFNPCFNGSMYKNENTDFQHTAEILSFNPCFNGSMYKNKPAFFAIADGLLFQSLF